MTKRRRKLKRRDEGLDFIDQLCAKETEHAIEEALIQVRRQFENLFWQRRNAARRIYGALKATRSEETAKRTARAAWHTAKERVEKQKKSGKKS